VGVINGGIGMARPEQSILVVTVKCGGCMGSGCEVISILHVAGTGGSCVCAGAWLLVVIVTLLEEQSVGAWSAGTLGFSSANGANGLLFMSPVDVQTGWHKCGPGK
jgi:hypothetical protein